MVFILLSKLSLLFLIFMFIGALPECMYIYVQVLYALKLELQKFVRCHVCARN